MFGPLPTCCWETHQRPISTPKRNSHSCTLDDEHCSASQVLHSFVLLLISFISAGAAPGFATNFGHVGEHLGKKAIRVTWFKMHGRKKKSCCSAGLLTGPDGERNDSLILLFNVISGASVNIFYSQFRGLLIGISLDFLRCPKPPHLISLCNFFIPPQSSLPAWSTSLGYWQEIASAKACAVIQDEVHIPALYCASLSDM